MATLHTDAEIDGFLTSGQPGCVVGLNGHGYVIIELPAKCNCMTMTADNAEEMARCLQKWAVASRKQREGK